ncbi:MAG TPA: D-amino-acid transaminase [Longimicrobiales bacterium]|nr:D-amino-acid transaminase [Longimicrobiales bacterium]
MQVYLNGSYIDHTAAVIPVDDRGFLFADGVYEVVRVYNGRPFLFSAHIQRLRAGLAALRISDSVVDGLEDIATRLIANNGVSADGTIYIQVTRGVAPRKHAFPADSVTPTLYAFAKPFRNYPAEHFERGVAAITVPDTRWSRCDIKSIALLPNVLANQQAHEAGAFEALFVKDGIVIEGSHSNLFAVLDGTLITYPSSNYILSGITRNLVLHLARELGIPAREAPLYWEQLGDVEELFLSGTTTEITPLATVDGRAVGSGSRGPVTARLQEAFREATK